MVMAFKTQPLAIIFQILTLIQFSVVICQHDAVVCSNNGNYSTTNSYAADLTTLLASLSSNMTQKGFYSASVGEANAIAMCRSDTQHTTCSNCVANLAQNILQSCPNHLEAVIWSELCMLRYSNHHIFGVLATYPLRAWENTANVSHPREFAAVQETLMDELEAEAAYGGPLQKAAEGNLSAGENQTIYGLVQCTPDLSPNDCMSCLGEAAGCIPVCCDIPQGITIYMPSCQLRYEIYRFYQTKPQSPGPDNYRTRNIMISVGPMVALVAVVCAAVFVGKKIKQMKKGDFQSEEELLEISSVESIQYDFVTIRAATDDFSDANKLGQGGFGTVYKGQLENGRKIAVKRLSKDSGQGEVEFKNEVLLLAKLQHRNLVSLLGFSIKGMERLLVYEFVHNGSLDRFIFGGTNSMDLDWEKRYKIIEGVARGILYLHQDSRLRIVHRDLKASNVLLDEEMSPKISDFGLAKLVAANSKELTASRIVGTYGYMAPEYALHGQFSMKLDVYSFGMLVMEIVSGHRNTYLENEESWRDAWRSLGEGRGAEMIDPVLMAEGEEEMVRCIHIGLLCVQQNPDERPTMPDVVFMLNNSSLTLPLPHFLTT